MIAKLKIQWKLPADLNNIASIVVYRAADPNQNKSCQDVVNTGSIIFTDDTFPFSNTYIDEITDKGIYRYATFAISHTGESSKCATFVYQYDDKVDVTIVTEKNEATVQNFGTAEEDGNKLKYKQTIVENSEINLNDLIVPNYSEDYSVDYVYVFAGSSSTKIDGAPNLTITEDTEITVVCSKQKFTITIKGDEEFFRLKNGEKVYKNLSPSKIKTISLSMQKDKRDCYEFEKYTAEGDADPYGQPDYNPNKSRTKILPDKHYVLVASHKEKLSELRLSSNIPEIGEVSGEGEYSCFDSIPLVAKPISEKTKFKYWEVTYGASKIREGDPESVPEGLTSLDPITYNDLKIGGNVNLKAFFTKVFQVVLKIMGPNGIAGSSARGSISIDATDQSTSGNTITANIESINNPFDITATPKTKYRFDGWQLINGNVTGISSANSSINILSDAELHAVFVKFFTVFLRIFSTGVNGESMLSNSSLNGYDEVNNQISLNYDTVKPAGKYQFEKWVIDLFSSQPEYTTKNLSHTLDNDAIVKLYLLEVYSLILNSNIPSAVNLTGQGDYVFGSHENISISVSLNNPTVAPAYNFINWQSTQSLSLPSAKSGAVTIVEDTTITANVEAIKYTLTVSSEDNSKGTVSKTGGPDYDVFESITISTSPKGGSIFDRWEVVSSDYGLSPGANFPLTTFTLGNYGSLSLKAYFLSVYTLVVKYYQDGVEDVSKQVTYSRKENESSSITVNPLNITPGYEFDRWEVQSGNITISQPNVFGAKTITLSENAAIEFHALRGNELTLLIDLPGAASFSHGQANDFFRSTEDIDIVLSLNNSNPAIPTYRFLNNYTSTDASLITGLVNSNKSNTIRISGDVSITAHLNYVLYNFSATVDSSRGSITGTSPNGQYNTLESITLRAESNDPDKSIFKEWRKSDGTLFSTAKNSTITLANYGDLELEAVFENKYDLNLTIDYPDINDVSTNSVYIEDSIATLDINSSINSGYRFVSISINGGAAQNTLTSSNQTFTMNQDFDVVVVVEKVFVLTLQSNIPGIASLSGQGGYLATEDINIEAVVNTVIGEVIGHDFVKWEVISGSVVAGSGSTHGYLNNSNTTIRISEDTVVEAIFNAREYTLIVSSSESSKGLVGINNGAKGATKTENFETTDSISVQAQPSANHIFYRWNVVSADIGLIPGDTFTSASGFTLAKYGDLAIEALFLKQFTLTKKIYLDNNLHDTEVINLTELTPGSPVDYSVIFPSEAGYLIDRVTTSNTTFNVNNFSDQNIQVSPNGEISFYFRAIDDYSLIIKNQVNDNAATTKQVLTYDEVNNTATIPAISIPSNEKFDSWEITSGNTSTSFLNLNKNSWPTAETLLLNNDVVLTYRTLSGFIFNITASYPTDYDSNVNPKFISSHNLKNQSSSSPYFLGDIISISSSVPAHLEFDGWTLVSGQLNSIPTTLSAETSIHSQSTPTVTLRANLSLKYYSFTIVQGANGNTSGSSNSGNYHAFEDITLRANPNSNYQFSKWEYEVSANNWQNFNASAHDTIRLTGNLKIRPVFTGIPYNLIITINEPNWGSATGAGTYNYDEIANITATPNQGYKFTRWELVSGTLPANFNTQEANQSVNIRGNVEILLVLEALPLPRDGDGNILFPILSSDSNRGSEIDRNMLAMTKDGGAVVLSSLYVPTVERIRAVTGTTASDNIIARGTDPIAAIRIFNKDSSGNQIETLLTSEDSLSGNSDDKGAEGISYFNYSRSAIGAGTYIKTESIKGHKGRLAVSPDGTKVMCGNPGDYIKVQIMISYNRTTTYTPFGSTEYGNLTIGTVSNINSDGDIGTLSGTNVIHTPNASDIDYVFSRQSRKTFFGHSICIAKNFVAYSCPSSVSGYLPTPSSSSTATRASNSAPAFSTTEVTPGNANVVHVVPNAYANNTAIASYGEDDFNDQGHEKGNSNYITFDLGSRDIGGQSDDGSFSQFGRSIDVSRDSPTLNASSATNPIFVAITSVWRPSNSDLTYTNWTRSTSITKIIGVYEESGTIYKIGMGSREPSDTSSVKNPSSHQDYLTYRAAWNSTSLYVDEEPVIDYGQDYNTNSDYGQKVRLSPNGSIAVISNSRESGATLGTGRTDKPGEVKVLLRRPIVINYNSTTYNWFEYENVQSITIPSNFQTNANGRLDFAYDIAFEGTYLAISAPSEKTVFIYKWNSGSEQFDYHNRIYMSQPDTFGKAVVFDTRESGTATKIAISADESFFVLDIPGPE